MSLNRRIRVATGATLLSATILFSTFFGSVQSTYAAEPITVGGKVVVVDTDGDTIRMRSGAGTGNEQVGEAYEGQVLSVLAGPERDAKGYRWFKVKGPGGTGWIVAGYLEGRAGTAPVLKSTEKAATKETTTQATKQAVKPTVKISGFGKVSFTDDDPLRVRSAANREGAIITKLAPNTVVAVKQGPLTDSEGIAWYQISANGVTGWAMAQYLAQSQATAEVVSARPAPKPAEAPAPAPAAPAAPEPAEQARPAEAAAPAPAPAVAEAKTEAQPAAETRAITARAAEQPELSASLRADTVVSTAMRYVGTRYVFGGTSPSGFDCSGFIYYVLNKAGIKVNRSMSGQLASGPRVSTKDLRPGDLLFWSNTYKPGLSHAGIYIGNGKFVHAQNESTGVLVSDMWSAYWASRFTAAVRPGGK